MHIRKDKDPETTVKTIKDILLRNNIEVTEKDVISYGDSWYSLRLEIDGLAGIGTNGKGVTLDCARASAYAEFMERLQSGFLINRLFKKKNPRIAKNIFPDKEISEHLKKIGIFYDELTLTNKNTIRQHDYIREKQTYYHVNSNQNIELPHWFIETNCGSNGLCAGNTIYEALLQGINETQERYVRKQFFMGKLIAPTIDHSYFNKLKSYKLIKAIEEKGYVCLIKDFTCNGKYPVLGLVIADHTYNYYLVSLGADYDMDICLQRCITEAFQGRNFSLLFKQRLNTTFSQNGFFISCDSLETSSNYQSNILNSSGNYPFNIFENGICDNTFIKAFITKEISNEELFKLSVIQLLENGQQLYFKDYNFLGFPTYRVYIPGMSEVCDLSSQMIQNNTYFSTFDNLFYHSANLDVNALKELDHAISCIMNIPFYNEGNIIDTLIEIPISLEQNEIDLRNVNIFLSLCYLKHKKYEEAFEYFNLFLQQFKGLTGLIPNYQVFYITLQYAKKGYSFEEIISICKLFDKNKFFSILLNIDEILTYLPQCPDCLHCKQNKNCCFSKWEDMFRFIQNFALCDQNDIAKKLEKIREDIMINTIV